MTWNSMKVCTGYAIQRENLVSIKFDKIVENCYIFNIGEFKFADLVNWCMM